MAKGKNLDIDILNSNVDKVIKEKLGENANFTTNNKSDNEFILVVSCNGDVYKIRVQKNSNGTTSVTPCQGKNIQVAKEIVNKLIDISEIDDRSNFSFSVKNISDDDFNILQEKFKELKAKITTAPNNNENIENIFNIQGCNKDKIVITRYKNKNTLFQGKPIYLYKQLMYCLSEVLKFRDIIKAQEKIFDIKIEANDDEIDKNYKKVFPLSHKFLDGRLKDIILPVFYFNRLDLELEDYSIFTFPILRGLEGYIKKILKEENAMIYNKNIGECFTKSSNKWVPLPELKEYITNDNICKALAQLYTLYNEYRNKFFHVDKMIDTSIIIKTRLEAEQIIETVIQTIEDTYKIYKENKNN